MQMNLRPHYYSYGELVHAFRQFSRGGPGRPPPVANRTFSSLWQLGLNERGNVANFTPASYLGGGQVRPLIGSFHGTASKAV